jgi:pilus assembly protein TadC
MTKTPVPMTIHEAFRRLAEVMARKTPEERAEFKKTWLDSVHWFEAETAWMRQERLRNS